MFLLAGLELQLLAVVDVEAGEGLVSVEDLSLSGSVVDFELSFTCDAE